jgi:2-polyprenyl-6-methoxyphenol hydroxylase-like FAD-dependent oxidoreductase
VTTAGTEQPDVLVVGAGPTGLTLAAQLLAMGATCRIVDRQPNRVHESRALAIQPRTLEVLRGLGATQELVARGNDAVWVQLHARGRVVRVRLFGLGLDDTAFPFLLFVSQAETEQVLLDHLAAGGVRVERRVELVDFHADPDAVTCTLRHADGRTEQVRTRYLAGCDGAASTVRRQAGTPSRVAPTRTPSRWPTWRSTATWTPTPPMPSSARPACCCSSRWVGPPAGDCWACIPSCTGGRSRHGPRWQSCRRSPICSRAAGCGCAIRSG